MGGGGPRGLEISYVLWSSEDGAESGITFRRGIGGGLGTPMLVPRSDSDVDIETFRRGIGGGLAGGAFARPT